MECPEETLLKLRRDKIRLLTEIARVRHDDPGYHDMVEVIKIIGLQISELQQEIAGTHPPQPPTPPHHQDFQQTVSFRHSIPHDYEHIITF